MHQVLMLLASKTGSLIIGGLVSCLVTWIWKHCRQLQACGDPTEKRIVAAVTAALYAVVTTLAAGKSLDLQTIVTAALVAWSGATALHSFGVSRSLASRLPGAPAAAPPADPTPAAPAAP